MAKYKHRNKIAKKNHRKPLDCLLSKTISKKEAFQYLDNYSFSERSKF